MSDASNNLQKATRWLRPLAFPFDEGSPRATAVVLKHVNVQDKLTDVKPFKLEAGEDFDETALLNLLREIEGAWLDDVEGLGGTQKYVLVAFDAEKKQVGRLPLRVSAPMDEDGDADVGSEPATAKGLLAANMRHVDNAHRMAVGASATIIQSQQRMISRQAETIETLVGKALSTITLAEQLITQKHERQLEADAAAATHRRKDKFFSQVTSLLAPVAKKLTGAAGGTGSDGPFNQEEMKALFEGMTEEEFAAMKGALSPERFFLMLSLMQSFKPDVVTEGPPRGDDEPEDAPNGAGH